MFAYIDGQVSAVTNTGMDRVDGKCSLFRVLYKVSSDAFNSSGGDLVNYDKIRRFSHLGYWKYSTNKIYLCAPFSHITLVYEFIDIHKNSKFLRSLEKEGIFEKLKAFADDEEYDVSIGDEGDLVLLLDHVLVLYQGMVYSFMTIEEAQMFMAGRGGLGLDG